MNELSAEIIGDTLVFTFHDDFGGEEDSEVAAWLNGTLAALPSDRTWAAVADFRNIPIVRSSTLGLMISVRNRMHACGGTMAVCNLSDSLHQKMSRLRLSSIWRMEETLRDAFLAVSN